MWPPRIILHPTDFSEQAQYALRLANSLARDHRAHLVVLHVAAPPHPAGMLPPGRHPKRYYVAMRKKLRELQPLDAAVERKQRVAEGEPAPQILRVAQEIGCDLIIMGTHGRTGLKHLLMGSVAEEVVRKASCPVLTLKTPIEEPQPLPADSVECASSTPAVRQIQSQVSGQDSPQSEDAVP